MSQLFLQLSNWFMFYCFSRTLSNSLDLETVLTLVSLYFWSCMRSSSDKSSYVSRKWSLLVAALACAIRPTSAITWMYVGFLELYNACDRLKFVFLEVAPIGYVFKSFIIILQALI
jgi:phosphatidylinositol glycan class B